VQPNDSEVQILKGERIQKSESASQRGTAQPVRTGAANIWQKSDAWDELGAY